MATAKAGNKIRKFLRFSFIESTVVPCFLSVIAVSLLEGEFQKLHFGISTAYIGRSCAKLK